jgi:tRNA modification GTPase
MSQHDTIVAPATPPGRGGVGIVRLSGPQVPAMLAALIGCTPAARQAVHVRFRAADGAALDEGLALYFPAPHSYTGEAVLELHCHGGPVPVERLMRRALELGARRAQPGEFTQRAYLNGKLDLAQAEAVASLIDAASEAAARAALRSLQGELSARVRTLSEGLGALRAEVEATIDFADEALETRSEGSLLQGLRGLEAALRELRDACRQGRRLAEGLTVVIAGRPNAGKSTLLNRLAGHEAAIVTAMPGTTRDVLREQVLLDGWPLQLLDTAGLRAAEDGVADPIEAEGIRRAQAALAQADHILFVIDAAADPRELAWRSEQSRLPPGVPVTLVLNKADLVPEPSPPAAPDAGAPEGASDSSPPRLRLSARTGEGLEALRGHLKARLELTETDAGVVAARARHLEALARVAAHLAQAREQLAIQRAPELMAEELRRAQQALGEIVAVDDSEALLGRIFSTFCIGK